MVRVVLEKTLDLSVTGDRTFVPVPRGKGLRIAAVKLSGVWASVGLTAVSWAAGAGTAIGSGKAISAGGGVVVVSKEEMVGISEIAIEQSGTAEAGKVILSVTVDEDTES